MTLSFWILLASVGWAVTNSKRNPVIIGECLHGVTLDNGFANVALHKNVTNDKDMEFPDSLVDGVRDNHYHCAHTRPGGVPGGANFMEVDLGTNYYVFGLYLSSAMDTVLDNVEISMGTKPEDMELYFYHRNDIGKDCSIGLDTPAFARYVKVARRGIGMLYLCEMEVYSIQ